jgi:hypothetical protein
MLVSTTAAAFVMTLAMAPPPPAPGAEPPLESETPWVMRLVPQRNMWELGGFGGVFLPHHVHDLYDLHTLPHEKLAVASPSGGLRVAYFPLSFLGAEAEASGAWSHVRSNGEPVFIYGLRAHALLQLPLFRVVPFILGGYGALGVRSTLDAVGRDIDPAGHWGFGAKVFINRWLAVRLEGRHIMTAAAQQKNVVASHGEIQVGVSIPLGWHDKD